MLDLLKKGMLAGIGAAVLTRDKIIEATKSLVEEGKISTDEAEKLTEKLVSSGEQQWDEMNSKAQSSLKKIFESVEVIRRKEYMELKARVDLLENRLKILEQGGEQPGDTKENP